MVVQEELDDDCALIARDIWDFVNRERVSYPWPLSSMAAEGLGETLAKITGDSEATKIYEAINQDRNCDARANANRALRDFLKPHFANGCLALRINLARWVVGQWGGIHRGLESVDQWVRRLDDFSNEKVCEFVKAEKLKRISSWSKVLAFARPDLCAIYDARTAVILNCALRSCQKRERLYMPRGRNNSIEPMRKFLRAEINHCTLGYWDYMRILLCLRDHAGADNLLDVEMVLFANAPVVARKYLSTCAVAAHIGR